LVILGFERLYDGIGKHNTENNGEWGGMGVRRATRRRFCVTGLEVRIVFLGRFGEELRLVCGEDGLGFDVFDRPFSCILTLI